MKTNIDYSKPQKKFIEGLPKLTTEQRSLQYSLARDIINQSRRIGKEICEREKLLLK